MNDLTSQPFKASGRGRRKIREMERRNKSKNTKLVCMYEKPRKN